jgi:hypothetical protein
LNYLLLTIYFKTKQTAGSLTDSDLNDTNKRWWKDTQLSVIQPPVLNGAVTDTRNRDTHRQNRQCHTTSVQGKEEPPQQRGLNRREAAECLLSFRGCSQF